MKNILKATARGGETVHLDTSEVACMRFGFNHGQRIIDPQGDRGVVMGVAPTKKGEADVLWFAFDVHEGEVCYWDVGVDLEQEGFKRIDLTTKEALSEMVVCFRVMATTNGKAEVAVVRDVAIAAAQGRVFLQAGHKTFITNPVMVLFDKSGTRGDVFGGEFIEMASVYSAPIPSRYHRADINPGISVHDYDREVLKRRVTEVEAAVILIVVMALFAGLVLVGFGIGVILSLFFNPVLVITGMCILIGINLFRKKWSLMEQLILCGMWVAGARDSK